MQKIKTLIVGLGKIGFLHDNEIKNSYISHTKALKKFKYTELVCGVDMNKSIRLKFKKQYNIDTSNNLKDSITRHNPKFVIISVTTSNLYKVLVSISKFQTIKYVLVEKPVGYDHNKIKKIFNVYKKKRKKLFINYNRSYQKKFFGHFSKYKTNKHFKSIFFYNQGLLNNCSHFLNLILMFLDLPKKVLILDKGNSLKKDIQADVKLIFKNGEVYLISNEKSGNSKSKYVFFDGINKVYSEDNFTKLIRLTLKKNNRKFGKKFILKEKIKITKKNYQTDVYNKIFKCRAKSFGERINQSGIKVLILYKKILNSYNKK